MRPWTFQKAFLYLKTDLKMEKNILKNYRIEKPKKLYLDYYETNEAKQNNMKLEVV